MLYRTIIYAKSKSGLTIYANQQENALIFNLEPHTPECYEEFYKESRADNTKVVHITDFDTLKVLLQKFIDSTKETPFKTIIIDNWSWLERLLIGSIRLQENAPTIDHINYGKGYSLAYVEIENLLKLLDQCRLTKNVNIIITGHATEQLIYDDTNDRNYSYYSNLKSTIKTPKGETVKDLLIEWCDEIQLQQKKICFPLAAPIFFPTVKLSNMPFAYNCIQKEKIGKRGIDKECYSEEAAEEATEEEQEDSTE